MVTAYGKRTKQEQEERIVLAYLGAYWNRVKKMPSIKSILGEEKPKHQTPEDMLVEIKKLNAAFGGTTY